MTIAEFFHILDVIERLPDSKLAEVEQECGVQNITLLTLIHSAFYHYE